MGVFLTCLQASTLSLLLLLLLLLQWGRDRWRGNLGRCVGGCLIDSLQVSLIVTLHAIPPVSGILGVPVGDARDDDATLGWRRGGTTSGVQGRLLRRQEG
jgi:hypothetical protein